MRILIEGAARLGLSLDERQVRRFQLYYEMLIDWNSRVNLTAITDYEGVQVRHFLDSLTVGAALLDELGPPVGAHGISLRSIAPLRTPPGGFSVIDIGTGAGFPGVPLKIMWPGIRLVVADSVGKKTAFLKELVSALELENVEVLTARAEELGWDKAHRARYDAVTARAVASLPVLCEYCLPLAKVGGWALAPKKGDISQELRQAEKASGLLGGGASKLHSFVLPGEEEERYVLAIPKVRETPPGYPRRVGLAKSRPLGS